MHSCLLNCFVANRISEIQLQSTGITWNHVPYKQNLADIVSRGSSAKDLTQTMWFKGPAFLYLEKSTWSNHSLSIGVDEDSLNLERRKTVTLKCRISGSKDSIINDIINNNSSFIKILRILSFIWRVFIKANQDRKLLPTSNSLSSSELDSTFWKIVSAVQKQCYHEDIMNLANNKKMSSSLHNLTPFLHNLYFNSREFPILRVGERLLRAPITYDAKFPALLPKNHRFTQLYIEFLHQKHLHAGPKVLFSDKVK